jgi:uncharacterized membrane protein YfcA
MARGANEVTAADLAIVLVVLAVASAVQATTGFGFALLAMPLLSAVIGPTSALAVTSLLSIPNSSATAWSARADADRPTLRRLVAGAVIGMPFGLLLLESVSERVMQLLIAAAVAIAAIALAAGLRLRRAGGRIELAAGLLSGVLSTSTGTSGPPIVICLQSKGFPSRRLRATISTQFAITGWVGVVLLAARGHIHRDDVLVAIVAMPVLLFAWRLGAGWFTTLTQLRFDRLVVVLLIAAAATAAVRAF